MAVMVKSKLRPMNQRMGLVFIVWFVIGRFALWTMGSGKENLWWANMLVVAYITALILINSAIAVPYFEKLAETEATLEDRDVPVIVVFMVWTFLWIVVALFFVVRTVFILASKAAPLSDLVRAVVF